MAVKGDLLIRGGTIVDPARNLFGEGDILLRGNKVVEVTTREQAAAETVIDATGYIVTPGLIDYHTHIFHGGTEPGFAPDLALLPMGVTTAVDQGSSGTANCEAFMKMVANGSRMRIFATLNVSSAGQVTEKYPENVDPRHYDLEQMKELFGKYSGKICGLKLRHDRGVVGELGMEPLKAAVNLAEKLGCRLIVHTADPPGDATDIVDCLRPGDVFCHCYHGKGSSIIAGDGTVKTEIRQARRRGVIFDTSDARVNHSYAVIKAALADGFKPDVISTDLVNTSLFGNMVFGLPAIMSKYLGLGLSLSEVVAATTAQPAGLIGMEGTIGTLAPGAYADVAIFSLADKSFTFKNRLGETFEINRLLLPKLTILNGKVVFRQLDFPF